MFCRGAGTQPPRQWPTEGPVAFDVVQIFDSIFDEELQGTVPVCVGNGTADDADLLCNGAEVRLTPTTLSAPKDHNIQRKPNTLNTVDIYYQAFVMCPYKRPSMPSCS